MVTSDVDPSVQESRKHTSTTKSPDWSSDAWRDTRFPLPAGCWLYNHLSTGCNKSECRRGIIAASGCTIAPPASTTVTPWSRCRSSGDASCQAEVRECCHFTCIYPPVRRWSSEMAPPSGSFWTVVRSQSTRTRGFKPRSVGNAAQCCAHLQRRFKHVRLKSSLKWAGEVDGCVCPCVFAWGGFCNSISYPVQNIFNCQR